MHVRVHEPVQREGWTERAATIERPGQARTTLWYRVQLPAEWRLSESSDAFTLVPLFKAMRAGLPLHVEGEMSPSLLANLEELQEVWVCWHPRRFTRVEIVPQREREQTPGEEGAIFAFSGGVDSAFTALRHATGAAGRRSRSLRAGVMAHGFDAPIEEGRFAGAADKAEAMLASLGIPLVRMATNVRRVEHAWDTVAGAAITSCLHLLQPNARAGLVPGSEPYQFLGVWTWGSHPVTDPLLSSASLPILNDGSGYSRPQKIRALGRWPEALEHLRVCWAGETYDGNCGRCEKCIRTILDFRAVGLPLPPCFPADVADRQIRWSRERIGAGELPGWRQLLDAAEESGISASWLRAAQAYYYRNKRRQYRATLADYVARRWLRKRISIKSG
jgi:hypothetical protein